MSKNLTLEQFLGSASYYLSEMDTAEEREEKEIDEATDDEGLDEIPADDGSEVPDEEPVEDVPEEIPADDEVEEVSDEEPSDDDLGDDDGEVGDEIEEKEDGDITIKDVSNAVKTLSKNLAATQKKITSINFGNMPFQKQQEVLDALRNVYESARGFAAEMGTFNSVEWK